MLIGLNQLNLLVVRWIALAVVDTIADVFVDTLDGDTRTTHDASSSSDSTNVNGVIAR